jgi:hypothetical protein
VKEAPAATFGAAAAPALAPDNRGGRLMSLWFKPDDKVADNRKIMERLDTNSPELTTGSQADPPPSDKRRTTRLSIAVPVTVIGKDERGESFEEETNTLNISRDGALLALHHRVTAGSELTIENRFLEVSIPARVVSFRDRISPADPDHVQVALAERKNVWGIQYPPKDWLKLIPPATAGSVSLTSSSSGQSPSMPPATAAADAVPSSQPSGRSPRHGHAPAHAPSIEIDLGGFEKQAEQSAEALLKAFGARLAKLGAQMGTRIQADLTAAAERVEEKTQKLASLDERLSSLSHSVEGTVTRGEAFLTSAEGLSERSSQVVQQRQDEFQRRLRDMLDSALHDFDDRINRRVLASTMAQKEQHSRLQQETVQSLREIQDGIRSKVESISQEVLASVPVEIDRNRTEAMAQIDAQAEEKLNAAIRVFEQRLQTVAAETEGGTTDRWRSETLAKLTEELDERRAETADRAQQDFKQILETGLVEFERRIQASAAQTQETASERLKAETLSRLLPELVASQVDSIEQARERVRQAVDSAVNDFQQRLQTTSTETRDRAASELEEFTLTKLAPQLEARQTEVITQAEDRVKQTVNTALGEFEQRLQTTAAQAQETASSQIGTEVLAKLAPQLEARQTEVITQAEDRVKQTVNTALGEFEQRLQSTAVQAQETASSQIGTEVLAKLTSQLEARQTEVITQAEDRVKQTVNTALGEFEQRLQSTAAQAQETASSQIGTEVLAKLAPQLEARQTEVITQAEDRVKQTVNTALGEFEQRLQSTADQAHESAAERLGTEVVDRLAPQFEARHHALAEQTEQRAQKAMETSLGDFERQLQARTEETQKAFTQRVAGEVTGRIVPQLEACQWEAVEQARRQIADHVQASFGDFERRLQSTGAQIKETSEKRLRAELLAALAPELQSCKVQALEQTQTQVSEALQCAMGEFRQQVQHAATEAEERVTEQLGEAIVAKFAPQLEACQAETLDATRNRVQQTLEDSLAEFSKQLAAVAEQSGQAASQRLEEQLLGRLMPELESRERSAVEHADQRVQESVQVRLNEFEQGLQAASGQAQHAALAKLVEETKKQLATVRAQEQAEILEVVRRQTAAAITAGIQSFRTHVANEVASCRKSADAMLQKPSELIRKYAEDTMAMLRDEMMDQRNAAVESAKLEVRAIMRSTLTSLTEEATAFTGEFRDQIRSAWDGMKSRGLEDLETLQKEAMEHQREWVLQRLQKDAEDLTQVAVGQFRSKSEEAIREANDAVNQRVGAAAFLLKDWMDQATSRLERSLETVEARVETAFESAQARSLRTQAVMMEKVNRQAEEIALELHDRFQQAASALRGAQRQRSQGAQQSSDAAGDEVRNLPARSRLDG